MPVIECGLCVLRAWRPRDLDSLVRHANNPNVAATLRDRFPFPYTRTAGRLWLKAALALRPATALAIAVDGEGVGGVGIEIGQDVNRHTAELGYWLGEACWNRGIATAAVQGFIPWAAQTFGLQRMTAKVFENNPASARVLEKCGFEREGILRKNALKDGKLLDEWVYGVILEPIEP